MPFLTNDPLPQCLQRSSATRCLLARDHDRGCTRYLLEVKCLHSWADRRRRGRLSRDRLGWQQLALARAAVARGPPVVVLHRPEELPLQRPGVGLLDPQPPPELDRGDPFRRRRDQPDRQEPARERQLGAGEDRAGRGRRLVPARGALDLRPGAEPGPLATAADRADEALGPAQLLHRRPAPLLGAVGRPELRLAQAAHPPRQLAPHPRLPFGLTYGGTWFGATVVPK